MCAVNNCTMRLRHPPSLLSCTVLSSFSSSLLLPPHLPVAHISLAEKQNEFLDGTSSPCACCCLPPAAHHLVLCHPCCPGDPRSPHAVDMWLLVRSGCLTLYFCQTLMTEIWASCCKLVATLRDVKKKKKTLSLRRSRYAVNRCYVHEWKCIPVDSFLWGIWHRALKGVSPSFSQDWPWSLKAFIQCSNWLPSSKQWEQQWITWGVYVDWKRRRHVCILNGIV